MRGPAAPKRAVLSHQTILSRVNEDSILRKSAVTFAMYILHYPTHGTRAK